MRIGTASTRRALDRWKRRARGLTTEFQAKRAASALLVFASPRRGKILLLLLIAVALSLNFAAVGLLVLTVTGFLTAKLCCYRFVNSIMRLISSANG